MVRRLVITAVVLALLCTPAFADHWKQNATLLPGKYLVVYKSVEQTAQLHAMYQYFDMMGIDRVTNLEWTGFAAMFNIDDVMTTDKFVQFLNTEPVTTPESGIMLFRLMDNIWLTVPLPCKWFLGEYEL